MDVVHELQGLSFQKFRPIYFYHEGSQVKNFYLHLIFISSAPLSVYDNKFLAVQHLILTIFKIINKLLANIKWKWKFKRKQYRNYTRVALSYVSYDSVSSQHATFGRKIFRACILRILLKQNRIKSWSVTFSSHVFTDSIFVSEQRVICHLKMDFVFFVYKYSWSKY